VSEPQYPTLVLDDARGRPDTAGEYTIPPADGLTLDLTQLTLAVPPEMGVSGPNAIHLVVDEERYYRVEWPEGGRAVLDARTLRPLRGGTPFTGLRAGENAILAVGHDDPEKNRMGKVTLKVLWVARLKVE